MSTRDIAYSIFNQLNEQQLEGFINMFSRFFPTTENTSTDKSDSRLAAFAELDAMTKKVNDLDYEKELEEYRKEKYGS